MAPLRKVFGAIVTQSGSDSSRNCDGLTSARRLAVVLGKCADQPDQRGQVGYGRAGRPKRFHVVLDRPADDGITGLNDDHTPCTAPAAIDETQSETARDSRSSRPRFSRWRT